MIKTFLKFSKIALVLVFLFLASRVGAQNNLTMKAYGYVGGSSIAIDGSTLDQIFGTVTINGTIVTTAYVPTLDYTNLPTSVSGYAGIQAVWVMGIDYDSYGRISIAQANALIAYVKGGGILIGNMEGLRISNDVFAIKYLGESFFCSPTTLTPSPFGTLYSDPSYAYHPGNGPLLLNTNATSVSNTSSFSSIQGVPSENAVYSINTTASCGSIQALDFVVPSYPGVCNCGVNGMALLSGEAHGILTYSPSRLGTQSNKNYAQLMYDFLYDPTAMAMRRAWSTISTNKNTTCPPAMPPASATAPALSATTTASICPALLANLSGAVTSTAATLKWYTDTAHTTTVADATQVPAGTYYAFYYDATHNCYSPASQALTVTITNCCTTLASPTVN